MEALTELSSINFLASGPVEVRLSLSVKNGDAVLSQTYHRFTTEDVSGLEKAIYEVCSDLVLRGFPAIGQADIDKMLAARNGFKA